MSLQANGGGSSPDGAPTVPAGYVSATHARWLMTDPDRRWRELEATLVFADVSGFTAMSEKLARRGKIGAEETTEAVNRVFDGLLGAVRGSGGELLKFGGDAVLALFEGDAHPIRGAAAALGMQAAMKPLRRFKTAAGTVSLRLSSGVASGRAHLFLAGGAPRELMVAGPLASEVVSLESAAEAGQVLAGPGVTAHLPERCLGEAIEPGILLRSVPLVPMVAIPEVPAGFDPRPALPLHLHDHVPGHHEHRFASIAFIQFKGTDGLLAAEGPAAVARFLNDLVATTSEACLAYGVTLVSTDVDRDGGKIILAAGAPTASPDDEDRLLHALRSILSHDWRLPVRAGANRGRIFMVDIGPPHRRVWSVMGDAVNLAARVMGKAQPGQLLATPSVLERVRDDFEREPVEPFMVKGKAAPVNADVIGPAHAGRRAHGAATAPIVGRDRELGIIRGALAEARRGGQRVIELVGEPGIGKSRLVEATLAAAAGMKVVNVAGGPYAAHSPYRAVRAPLRQLLGLEADDDDTVVEAELRALVQARIPKLAPWLPLIGIPFGLQLPSTPETASLSPEFARARMQAVTGGVVDLLLGRSVTLLVVEDAHWLDEASGEFISHLVRHGRQVGWCVLLTRRDVDQGLTLESDPRTEVLRLGPLGAEAALALLQDDADDDAVLPPGAEAKLVERAAGNPLLLQELLAAARAGEPLDALPDSVEALVASRIDTLPQGERNILRQAAVLGIRVQTQLLEQLLELSPFAVQAAMGRLQDFLVEDGRGMVRFRHGLLRDAAYEALPFRRRRELHARAADLIAARAGAAAHQQAELLTIHFHAAHRWKETWRFASVAGKSALDRAAPVEAASFFGKALEAGRAMRIDPIELVHIGERQGEAYRLSGRFAEAGAAFDEARRRARGYVVAEADLCLKIGRLRERSRHVTQALRWLTRGLKLLEDLPPTPEVETLRARMWLTRATVRMHGGRLHEAISHAERAIDIADAADNLWVLGNAYTLLHWAYTELGSPERERYRDLALPIFEELGDDEWQGKALNNAGIDAYWSGRWDEAVEFYERGRAALERVGDVVEAAVLLNNIAEIRSDQGRLEEAERQLREALATFRSAAFVLGAGLAYSNLGRVASRRGDTEEAAELFARARERLSEVGAHAMLVELETREAERLVFAGDHAAALALAGEIRRHAAERQVQPALMALNQRVAALAKLQAGDPEGARARLLESVEIARPVGAVYEEALSLEALSRLQGDQDPEVAARAVELFQSLGIVSLPRIPLLV